MKCYLGILKLLSNYENIKTKLGEKVGELSGRGQQISIFPKSCGGKQKLKIMLTLYVEQTNQLLLKKPPGIIPVKFNNTSFKSTVHF